MLAALRARLSRWFPDPEIAEEKPEVDPDYGDLPPLREDVEGPIRFGAKVTAAFFAVFMGWSVLAPLDEGVALQGMVTLSTKRKTVQHLTGGIIKAVHVQEAQIVKVGDVLMTLNDGSARASYESARQRYLGGRAVESRLLAEQTGAPVITYHPELVAGADDPYISQLMANQTQLLRSRRLSYASDLSAIEEAVRAQEAMVAGLGQQLGGRRQHLDLIKDERDSMRELVREGYAPRNKQRELDRMVADSGMALSELQGNLARTQRTVAELKLRRTQREQEIRREIDSQLADVRRELMADEERYKAAKQELDRVEIRAPAGGAVVGISAQTVGGVIPPGARLMDIVPSDEKLIIEGRLAPHLVDRVRPGQSADVRFSGFSHEPQLVVLGQLDSISADLLTDQSGLSYYLVRVSLTPEGQHEMGKRNMKPGMPAEIVIKTGERSLLTYVLGPLLKRMSKAMIEE